MLQNNISQIQIEVAPDKKYPIFIDSEPIKNLEAKIYSYTKANKVLLVVNEKVNRLYKDELNFKNSIKFVLKDGEDQKNFKNYQKILKFASENKLERKDAIVAIGGGVVGDMAGFAAATYLRGIDFIQIPTTLLACVDSSVGGKVGINTEFGKNLVGSFYQPKAVFCNLNFLKTLDDRQFKTGLAEIVKYAYIEKSAQAKEDYGFFEFLSNNSDRILSREENALAEIIAISLNLKASVVAKDEKEQGLRRILNFGHTLGHAIEKLTNYKRFTHGEAVAIGMSFVLNLALEKELISQEYFQQSFELLKEYSLIKVIPRLDEAKLINAMNLDKKVEDGKINFILPTSKSTVECYSDITKEEIKKCLKRMLYS